MTLYIIFLILFLIVSILDVISTNKFLKLGLKEANPVIRYFIEKCGNKWWIPKMVLSIVVIFLSFMIGIDYGIYLLVFGILVIGGASIWNFYLIHKASSKS